MGFRLRLSGAVAALVIALTGIRAHAFTWDPVPPEVLNSPPPPLDPDAPAEAMFRRVDIDDSEFPSERHFHEYVRYRIFDPERAVQLTRVTLPSIKNDGEDSISGVDIRARLISPDGSVREFGKADLRERDNAEAGGSWAWRLFGAGLRYKERFLAVSGVQKGSMLELLTDFDLRNPNWFLMEQLQLEQIPIRQLRFHYRATENDWAFHEYVLHGSDWHATATPNERHRTIDLSATDLPGVIAEPFRGPGPDFALTYVSSYQPRELNVITNYDYASHFTLDPKSKPWSVRAAEIHLFEHDRSHVTRDVRAISAQVVGDAATDQAKARRIHNWVQQLHHRFLIWKASRGYVRFDHYLQSPDQVIAFERHPDVYMEDMDFVYLEEGMDHAAGLETQAVLLPDREYGIFSRSLVADAFLPEIVARVRLGQGWTYSDPVSDTLLPLGALPARNEGQMGLLAEPDQTFLPIPGTPAEASARSDAGNFDLSATGELTGQATRSLTGHWAEDARHELLGKDGPARRRFFREHLAREFDGARITIQDITGADDPDLPLRIVYDLRWPGYAEVTKSRLIFHPSVCYGRETSPFSSASRHYPFEFGFRKAEHERSVITLPEGFHIESKAMPPSIPARAIDYRVGIAEETGTGKIHYERSFTTNILRLNASAAPALKSIYDQVAVSDQFELVAAHQAAASKEDTGEAP